MSETLSDKISSILSAAPASFDPEDDVHEETAARVVGGKVAEASDDEHDELLSSFRKQNVDLLEDVDKRYQGKKGSRKALLGLDDWGSEGSESYSDAEDDDAEPDDEAKSEDDAADKSEDDADDKSEDESGEDEEESEVSGYEDDDVNEPIEDASYKHLESDVSGEANKGNCVRQQLSMWENLLEMRIQLQKCLLTANKLPQTTTFNDLKETCGAQFTAKVAESKSHVTNLLEKLLYLQLLLLRKYPETKNLLSGEKACTESDEEIPSDTEDEDREDSDKEEVPRKKRKISEYDSELTKRFDLYKSYRNLVIQKWNDKTRLATTKSNATHSVTDQVEHILGDRVKLIKRTQLKRTDYEVLGEIRKENTEEGTEEYNVDVFDDTDFYHHLLRELIEFKSSDVTDPVQLGRQWLQLQNLRSKMKRKIDTRATKGRKIRYVVHSKLVNFMAPIDESPWQDEAKNELFNSLFGKNQPSNTI